MIFGLGTDIVDVSRFVSWADAPEARVLKIFSEQELIDCLQDSNKTSQDLPSNIQVAVKISDAPPKYIPEKLAARFAAKEAFFKALSSALVKLNLTNQEFSLMFACRHVQVSKTTWGVPVLLVDWVAFEEKIGSKIPKFQVDLSISHEKNCALAVVIVS
jgi:phosphopantetheine--protein transferase-like protein